MIKFIIVDDDKKWLKEYERIINDVFFKSEKEYEIYPFTKYDNELQKLIKDNSEQKVYLMDLDLEPSKYTGMDILREIREDDWDSEIIVVTNHDRMFETVHKQIYKTFDFIEKFDNLEERLKFDLNKIEKQKFDKGKFIYANSKITLQIYLKDIIYILRDPDERKLTINTSNNEFIVNMTVQEMLSKLDSRFSQCHRGCIINEDRVVEKNYNKGYFVTDTGKVIPFLSRKYRGDR